MVSRPAEGKHDEGSLARIAICGLMCLLLSSCAKQPPMRFSRADTTQQQFLQDRYVCIQEPTQTRAVADEYEAERKEVVNGPVMVGCMAARGYIAGLDGEFGSPPGGEIAMVQ